MTRAAPPSSLGAGLGPGVDHPLEGDRADHASLSSASGMSGEYDDAHGVDLVVRVAEARDERRADRALHLGVRTVVRVSARGETRDLILDVRGGALCSLGAQAVKIVPCPHHGVRSLPLSRAPVGPAVTRNVDVEVVPHRRAQRLVSPLSGVRRVEDFEQRLVLDRLATRSQPDTFRDRRKIALGPAP